MAKKTTTAKTPAKKAAVKPKAKVTVKKATKPVVKKKTVAKKVSPNKAVKPVIKKKTTKPLAKKAHYKEVSNFIAPVGKPAIGDTAVFSMMFYNWLLRFIDRKSIVISDKAVIEAFKVAKKAYWQYEKDDFRLFNVKSGSVYK